MDGRTDGRTNRQIDRQADGRTDGRAVNRLLDEQTIKTRDLSKMQSLDSAGLFITHAFSKFALY